MSALNDMLLEGARKLAAMRPSDYEVANLSAQHWNWGYGLWDVLDILTETVKAPSQDRQRALFGRMDRSARVVLHAVPAQELSKEEVLVPTIVWALQTLDSYPREPNKDPFESFLSEVDTDTVSLAEALANELRRLLFASP